ncbi:MAG: hypothetical protein ACMUIP_01195 [bacterium]
MKPELFDINIHNPKNVQASSSSISYSAYVILAIICIGLTIVVLRFCIYIPQKKQITEKKSDIVLLANQLKEIKQIYAELEERENCYLQLKEEAIGWYDKLFSISQALSKRTWLSEIAFYNTLKKTEDRKKIIIKGYIHSTSKKEYYAEIGELVMALNNSESLEKDFEPLIISYVKKSRGRPKEDIEFEIIGEAKTYK